MQSYENSLPPLHFTFIKHLINEDTNDLQQQLTEITKEIIMKKKILAICSVLVFTVLLTVVSAQAQVRGVYRANIPFDFTVGNKTYEKGDYIFKLKSPNYLATILTIKSKKGREMLVSAVVKNGSTSKNNKTSLVFNRLYNKYVLKKIVAPEFGFNAPKSKVLARLTRNNRKKLDTISIDLSN